MTSDAWLAMGSVLNVWLCLSRWAVAAEVVYCVICNFFCYAKARDGERALTRASPQSAFPLPPITISHALPVTHMMRSPLRELAFGRLCVP